MKHHKFVSTLYNQKLNMSDNDDENTNTMTLQELEMNIKSMIPDLQLASKNPAIANPFISNLKLSLCDKIKMMLLCFLVPIRLIMLLVVVTFCSLVSNLFLLGYKESHPPAPLNGYRKSGQLFLIWMSRVVCFICGFHNIKVKGKLSPEARIVTVAPHSSFMDAFIITLIGNFTGVSRIENLTVPIFGSCTKIMQPTTIARSDKNSKMAVVKEIKRKVSCKDWPPTLIFAEGTCTNRQSLIFFKPGAFYPGVPVQPVIIRYLDELDYISWTWMGPGSFSLLCVMMSRLYNKAEIEILPLYKPSEDEIADPFLYSRNVRDHMARVDNIPVTDHSFEDCRLMSAAKKLKLPMEAGIVEYYKISPMINMNCDGMINQLIKFAKMDTALDGVIDIVEFCDFLNMPPTEEVKTIFRIYDINKDGYINFREYLLGQHLISKPFNSERNIQTAFELLDSDNKGYIVYSHFNSILSNTMGIDEKYIRLMFIEMDSERNSKPNLEQFKDFCLNKPEYALLFIHFRKLHEENSSMTFPNAQLRRSSSIAEYEELSTVSI